MKKTKLTTAEKNLHQKIRAVRMTATCKMGMAHVRTRFVIRLCDHDARNLGVSSSLHLQIDPPCGLYMLRFVNLHGDDRVIVEFAPEGEVPRALDIADVRRDPVAAVVLMVFYDRQDRVQAAVEDALHGPRPQTPSDLRRAASPWRYASPS